MADDPTRPSRRGLALIGPISIVVVVAAILFAAWLMRPREPEETALPPKAPPEVSAPTATPGPPSPPPALTRADLVVRAGDGAAAYAARTPPPPGRDPFVGRPFTLRIPFGCGGPQVRPGGAQAFAEYDAQKRTIRLVARPADWTQLPPIQALPGADEIERVEGFWMPRPWTTSETCPPPRDDPPLPTPTPPAAQTLGLARLFEEGGSRVLRRGERPYEFVRKLPEGDASLLSHSYRLVLEGRVVGFGDGRAVRCWSETANHRPVCLFAVIFDRVAFEDAESGTLLAEWRE
jgi:hypothetical protein